MHRILFGRKTKLFVLDFRLVLAIASLYERQCFLRYCRLILVHRELKTQMNYAFLHAWANNFIFVRISSENEVKFMYA